ncbi:hypothetical protein D7V96_04260 [bacterium D16-59]|nr:hypothetical protein D7V96_04260 [bacterium D16-59]
MERLLKEDIVVYCAAGYGEKIYLKLVSAGCNVIGFCDNAERNKDILLLGKPIHNYSECRQKYPYAIYVIANSTFITARKISKELEHDGYVKNITYFIADELELQNLLPDKSENAGFCLTVKERPIILFGSLFLCNFFRKWVESLIQNSEVYICTSEDEISEYQKYADAIWIPLAMNISYMLPARTNKGLLLVQSLQNHGVKSFSRFFLSNLVYCEEHSSVCNKEDVFVNDYSALVKKVLFLKRSGYSGSIFIDSILDFHPDILYLGLNMWSQSIWHVIKKAMEKEEDYIGEIIRQIEKYLLLSKGSTEWLDEYRIILKKYIRDGKVYSERDLFIIIHLSYYEFLHGCPPDGKKPLVIYMDIHSNMVMRDVVFSWLDWMGFEVVLLEMIRSPYKRLGSNIKAILAYYEHLTPANILGLLEAFSEERVEQSERKYDLIRIRFEDLKMYPKIILSKLCQIVGISWDDSLLETTSDGKESAYIINGSSVTGFDLKPVYHPYEEYFDAFDRFRLDLFFREKNKAYGYSYVDREKYWMSLDEFGKLFEIPFQFEKFMLFQDEAGRKNYHVRLGELCMQILYMEENKEKYAQYFQFGDYLSLEDEELQKEVR